MISLVCAALLAAAVPVSAGEGYKGFERGEALISPQELKGLIDAEDPDLVLVAVAKESSFKLGHISVPSTSGDPTTSPKKTTPGPMRA